jgi:4-hydroxyphenylpyruvate dioxygenase-like putative hemolysin
MSLKFNKIDQIGIVVKDCEQIVKLLESFGLGPFQIFDRGVDEFYYKGKWNKIHIRNALCRLNNIQFELIEVTEVIEGSCAQKDFLDEHGPGMHHIAVYVDDLEEAVNAAAAMGIEILQKGATKGLLNWAYMDTESIFGFVVEFIELRKKRKVLKKKE